MTKQKKKSKNEFEELSPDELVEKSKEIAEFLESLENDYRNATISEESYKHTKEMNVKKLGDINHQLKDFGISMPEIKKTEETKKPANTPSKDTAPTNQTQQTLQAQQTEQPKPSDTPTNTPNTPPKETPQEIPKENDVEKAKTNDATDNNTTNEPPKKTSFLDKIKQHIIPKNNTPNVVQNQPTNQPVVYNNAPNFEVEMGKFSEKFSVELERINATIDAFKETRTTSDERIQTLVEGLAELRSNIFQKEASSKEQELKLSRLKELVDDVEPQKITKEFLKRDKFNTDIETRVEKLEIKISDMIKTVGEINELLKSIGGLENIANIDHEISKKMELITEKEKSINRMSSKIEKIFVDINKRLARFDVSESKQENMNEILDDVVKNVDSVSLKFENYLEKKEITKYQDNLDVIQKQMTNMMQILKKAVPFAEAKIPKEIQDLEDQREVIGTLLSNVKYEYELKRISDEEYKKIKKKNEVELEKIKKNITSLMNKMDVKTIESTNTQITETKMVNENVEDQTKITPNNINENHNILDTDKPTTDETKNNNTKNTETIISNDEPQKEEIPPKITDSVNPDSVKTGSDDKDNAKNTIKNTSANENKNESSDDVTNNQETAEIKNTQNIIVDETKTSTKTEESKEENKLENNSKKESKQNLEPIIKNETTVKAQESNVKINEESNVETKIELINESNNNSTVETNPLIEELNESLKQGLISKEAYEKTKKILIG